MSRHLISLSLNDACPIFLSGIWPRKISCHRKFLATYMDPEQLGYIYIYEEYVCVAFQDVLFGER